MPGNGKVFISHAPEDDALCAPLLAALDAWEVDYWFESGGSGGPADPSQALAPQTLQALAARDIFLRVCTAAAQRSPAVSLQTNAFRGLQAEAQGRGRSGGRVLLNVILDPGYVREPIDSATLFVDATTKLRPAWLGELGRALGVRTSAGRVSRRAVFGLGAAGALALATGTVGGVLVATERPAGRNKPVITRLTGQSRWIQSVSTQLAIPAVTAGGGTLYATSDQGLYALDGGTGKVLWHNAAADAGSLTHPLVVGQVVYIVSSDQGLFALHTKDGSTVWHIQFASDTRTTPAYANGTLYVAATDGNLYAIATRDGSQRWSAAIGNTTDLSEDGKSSPAVAGGVVYVGSDDHHLYAFDAGTGAPRWKVLTRGKVGSSPAVASGIVYAGSRDTYVYALSARDGGVRWRFKTDYDVFSAPAVVDRVVYVGSRDRYLYALDAGTGTGFWRGLAGTKDPSGLITGDPVDCRPALDGGVVYATAGSYLYAFDISDGSQLWRYQAHGNALITTQPVVANGLVYFGASDSNVYAINE